MIAPYKSLVAVSCALVVATALVYLGIEPTRLFGHLALTRENNAAAWWSGMLLALISLTAYDGYALWRNSSPSAARGWALLAPVFLFLSFSEIGSIHERLGGLGRELSIGLWPPLFALGALLAGACARALWLLWASPNGRRAVPWLVAGFVLFGLAPVQEYLEFELTLESPWALATRAALEEGGELLAMLVTLRATLPNTIGLRREHRFAALHELNTPFFKLGVAMAVVLTVATAMLTDHQRGQPADWIAATAFMAAGLVLLQSRNRWNHPIGALCCLASLAVVEVSAGAALTHYATQASGLGAYWLATLQAGKERTNEAQHHVGRPARAYSHSTRSC